MPSHKRVLVIAPHGSYRTMAFVRAAQELGIDVLVASEGKHSIVSAYALGLHIRFSEMQEALERIRAESQSRPFSAVLATDDISVELAASVAAMLGLPANSIESVNLSRRKDRARQRLQQMGCKVPDFLILQLEKPVEYQVEANFFPAVLKPVSLSASRGVMRVDNFDQLKQAVRRLKAILSKETTLADEETQIAVLERFVAGTEIAVEGILRNGELTILTVFDKPEPLNGPFFEESYYITPSRLKREQIREVHVELHKSCQAYGLSEGPIHAECRLNEAGVWILEIASRTIGGNCANLLRFGTGIGLEQLVLANAIGLPVSIEPQTGAAGVLMIPIPSAGVFKRVEGILEAMRVPGIEDIDIQIREGHRITPLPEGSSYLGFIFARGDDADFVENALREAHARLKIVIAPMWPIQHNRNEGKKFPQVSHE